MAGFLKIQPFRPGRVCGKAGMESFLMPLPLRGSVDRNWKALEDPAAGKKMGKREEQKE
jgi:hypothetical protein